MTVANTDLKIELFSLSRQPHDQERFARRVTTAWLGRQVVIPTAEDVIVTKLFWALHAGRGKDRDDARDVIAVQGGPARLRLHPSLGRRARHARAVGRDPPLDPAAVT